jgi:hypothetical protein
MTRAQIREAMQAVPVDRILLGANTSKEAKLTPKQKKFAQNLAEGMSKAEAYRQSRQTKAKPETASRRGQELAKMSAVQAQVEAFKRAAELREYASAARLRELVIAELTKHALDDAFPPAQRVKALELLGKVTEVAAFTERREVVQVQDAGTIRERLMQSLRLAVQTSAVDVEDTSADDLLAEITGARLDQADADILDAEDPTPSPEPDPETPPTPHPPNAQDSTPPYTHSIPHLQTPQNSEPPLPVLGPPADGEGVPVDNFSDEKSGSL